MSSTSIVVGYAKKKEKEKTLMWQQCQKHALFRRSRQAHKYSDRRAK